MHVIGRAAWHSTRGCRAAFLLCGLLAAHSASACALVLSEQRTGRVAATWPAHSTPVRLNVSFEHSVLGTTVRDSYEMRWDATQWRAHLIEETFAGEGYGLPYGPQAGEQMVRTATGWRLTLDRVIHPLVLLPLPEQNARITFGERTVHLASLSRKSLAVGLQDCAAPP
jgi:hypothetical protein